MSTFNRKRKSGGAEMISGKKRIVYKASVPRSLGPVSRQSMSVGGWAGRGGSGELKYVDVNSTALSTSFNVITWSTPLLLNGLSTGTTATTRVGRKITLKSVYLRWTAALGAFTANSTGIFRIVILYDKQANAAAPAATDIFEVNEMRSPNNLSNRDRFVVVADMMSEDLSVGNTLQLSGQCYKKLNLETLYNSGNAGTIADIASGSLYAVAAHTGTFLTSSPTLSTYFRVRYTDV